MRTFLLLLLFCSSASAATLPAIPGDVTFSGLPSSGIMAIRFDFETSDPDFSAVEFGFLDGGRIRLASVGPGNKTVTYYPGQIDGNEGFNKLVAELTDGEILMSLLAFGGAGNNIPMMLDLPSTLTITVTSIPEPSSLWLLGLAALTFWRSKAYRMQ